MTKRRAVAAVPPPPPAYSRSLHSSPTRARSDVLEEMLLATGNIAKLPHIGPLVAVERPIVSSWPQLPPPRVGTAINPSKASPQDGIPTTSSAVLPVHLVQFLNQQRGILDRMVQPDIETIVVMQFHVLDECCKRLMKHFPAYRDVYGGMQSSIQLLNETFGTMSQDIDTLRRAVSAANEHYSRQIATTAEEHQKMFTELQTFKGKHDADANVHEKMRIIVTQNEDLFEQLQRMKRKVAEADETSQHMSSRNVVLTVNQGRLEHEVERLNTSLQSAIMHHDADLKVLEHKNKTIEAMDVKIKSLEGRLEQAEASLNKATAEIRGMVDTNKSLSTTHSRVQQQLQQLLESRMNMSASGPSSNAGSRAVSPKFSSRRKSGGGGGGGGVAGEQNQGTVASPPSESGPQTPRPDWAAASMLLHDDALSVQLKDLPTSRERLRLVVQSLVVAKQKSRAAEADLVAMKMQRAVHALGGTNPQPPQQNLSTKAATRRSSQALAAANAKAKRPILDYFTTTSQFTEEVLTEQHLQSLRVFLNVPVVEVPRLEISLREIASISAHVFKILMANMVAMVDGGEDDMHVHCSSIGGGSNAADPDGSSISGDPVLRPLLPKRDTSFYSIFMECAEPYVTEQLVDAGQGDSTTPTPSTGGGVTNTEIAVRSFIRGCQDNEGVEAYARLFLYCIAGTVPPDTFLHFRKGMEQVRSHLLAKKDVHATGCCDPLTFTMAVKKCWPFIGDLEMDVIRRLATQSADASSTHRVCTGALPQRSTSNGGSHSKNDLFSPTDTTSPQTLSIPVAEEPWSPQHQAHAEADHAGTAFDYMEAFHDTSSNVHQYLLHTFLTALIASHGEIVQALRSLAERTGSHDSNAGGRVTATVGSVVASLQKWDSRRDKEEWRRFVARLLGREGSMGDVAPTARCDLHLLIDAVRKVVCLRSSPLESAVGGAGVRSPAPVPILDTREVVASLGKAPTPPPQPQQTRRKSSVVIKKS